MIKMLLYLIILLFLSHCSIDTKSGIWENTQNSTYNKKIKDIDFDEDLSFEEFKENVILYGKKSKFPKLTEN